MANIFVTVKVAEGWFRSLKWVWIGTIIILIFMVCGIFILQKKAKTNTPIKAHPDASHISRRRFWIDIRSQ